MAAPDLSDDRELPSPLLPAELISRLAPRSERRVVVGMIGFTIFLRVVLFFVGYVQTEIQRAGPARVEAVEPTALALQDTVWRLWFADPGWYLQIANQGYAKRPFTLERQENWGFFPGWPLIIRLGGPLLGGTERFALIASNLASLIAVVLLFMLFRMDYPIGLSTLAVGCLYASPWAYHLYRPGAEPTFLLFSIAAVLAARRGRMWWAGLAGAMAVLIRLNGLFLFPALLLVVAAEVRRRSGPGRLATFIRMSLPALLVPGTLLALLLYLRHLTGNAFAYFDMQRYQWLHSGDLPFRTLGRWFLHPMVTANWDLSILAAITSILLLALVGAGAWQQFHKRLDLRPEYWFLIAMNLVLVFSRNRMVGVGRYLLPVFPIFLLLALLFQRRPAMLLAMGAAAIVVQTFLFTNLLAFQQWAG